MAGTVFVSYAHVDREYVEKLVHFLAGEGLDVWYDDELPTVARWDEVLKEKIATCAAFVVVTTRAAHQSKWVIDEVDEALNQERDVLMILLDGVHKIPGTGRSQCEILMNGEMPGRQFVQELKNLTGLGEALFELKAHDGPVRWVAYPESAPVSMVASAGKEKGVRIWNPTTSELLMELPDAIGPIAFNRHGTRIATGGPGHSAHLWDPQTGELVKQVGEHSRAITSISLSGSRLITGSGDTTEFVWDLNTGVKIIQLGGRVKPSSPLVVSPDGEWVVAPSEGAGAVRAGLWRVEDGRYIGGLRGHRDAVLDVTVSWDGRYVATASRDHTALVWNAKTLDEFKMLGGHHDAVRAVAFAPNGYTIATGSMDHTIRLWDALTGAPRQCITKHAGGIYDLAYAPDGRTLASGHGDGAIRLWRA